MTALKVSSSWAAVEQARQNGLDLLADIATGMGTSIWPPLILKPDTPSLTTSLTGLSSANTSPGWEPNTPSPLPTSTARNNNSFGVDLLLWSQMNDQFLTTKTG